MCESEIYKNDIIKMLNGFNNVRKAVISVKPKLVSKVTGQKRSNIEYFKNMGIEINIVQNYEQKENLRLIKIE